MANSASRNEQRKKQKANRKASQRALYAGYRDSGNNKKSKRFKLSRGRIRRVRAIKHPFSPCGNVGCISCSGISFTPWLFVAKTKYVPEKMPQWMYQVWSA